VDQRGTKRPLEFDGIANAPGGDGTDIGAFERSDPTAVIDSGPSGTTNDPTPTFNFHARDGASALQCRLDAGSFAPCVSPKTIAHLADGAHTFQVRARDGFGNIGPTASRSFTVKTAAISRSGSTLIVTAAPGAKDNLKVIKPSASTIRISDSPVGTYTGSGVHAVSGSGCTRSGDYVANCNSAGIALVKLLAAGGTDRVINATALPSSLNGGGANDVLTGGSGPDTLTGATGSDSFKGMNGNDTLFARDLTSDALINCDGGTKPGAADKADLDALPKDPNSIVFGCETKTRH
jgi:Ca2+-binding RTX toxin-like protein